MGGISNRSEGNERRKDRLAKIDKGPGTFVYDGKAHLIEWTPTPKLVGVGVAKLTSEGLPVIGHDGRQVYEKPNQIEKDSKTGAVVMGGVPKVKKIPIDTRVIWGVEFPKGKPVLVGAELALKLRCLEHFEEVKATKEKKQDQPKA